MSPSFYQSTPFPNSLLNYHTVNNAPSAPPDEGLPTLAVVLGLIAVLVGLAFVAGILIYVFRGRLFASPPEQTDEEKLHPKAEMKGIHGYSGRFDPFSGSSVVPHPGAGAPPGSGPPLQPFSFDPAKPPESHYKQLLHLQQIGSGVTDKRNTTIPTLSIYNASRALGPVVSRAKCAQATVNSDSLKVSQSCPAEIGQFVSCSGGGLHITVASIRAVADSPEPVHRPLPTPPTLMYSYESTSSVYSEDSAYSSSTSESSVNWDYYMNDSHAGLFYEPTEAAEGTRDEMDSVSTDTSLESVASSSTGGSIRRTRAAVPFSKRPYLVGSNDKIHSRLVRRSETRRRRASRARQLFDLRRRVTKTYIRFNPAPDCLRQVVSEHFEQVGADASRTFSEVEKTIPTTLTYLERTPPRTSSRHALNGLLDSPLSAMTKYLNAMQELVLSSPPPFQQPSILLNDAPADDLTSMSPPRFQRAASPPRNPELLNARWKPRPPTPRLNITVFSRTRSASSSSYVPSSSRDLGHRVNVTPPVDISLAELRGLVQRALGHDVRMLRGKVFIGSHSMLLPLASERFFGQWVRERMRDGGNGVIEAWHS